MFGHPQMSDTAIPRKRLSAKRGNPMHITVTDFIFFVAETICREQSLHMTYVMPFELSKALAGASRIQIYTSDKDFNHFLPRMHVGSTGYPPTSILSEKHRAIFDQYAKRIWILMRLAESFKSAPASVIVDYWNNAETTIKAIKMWSEINDVENHYTKLKMDPTKEHENWYLQFPPLSVVGYEKKDGNFVVREEEPKPESDPV